MKVGWLASKAFETVTKQFPNKYKYVSSFLESKVKLYESNVKPAVRDLLLKYLHDNHADSLLTQCKYW